MKKWKLIYNDQFNRYQIDDLNKSTLLKYVKLCISLGYDVTFEIVNK